MTRFVILAAVIVGIAFAVIKLYLYQQEEIQPDVPVAEEVPTEPSPVVAEEPKIQHPVPEVQKPPESEDTAPQVEPEPPLPTLNDSDDPIKEALGQFLDLKKLKKVLVLEAIINRFVVTIDNLMTRNIPIKYRLIKPAKGKFLVSKDQDGNEIIDPANYKRYTLYMQIVEKVDTKALANLYIRYYTLVQEAYENLGYPDKYFNDLFIETLDHLIDTPKMREPIKLVRPSVYYKYADPKLEKLSAGQKILLRMGPDNADKVKAKLKELKQALIHPK